MRRKTRWQNDDRAASRRVGLGSDQGSSSSESLGGILPTVESSSSSSAYVVLTNFFGLLRWCQPIYCCRARRGAAEDAYQ